MHTTELEAQILQSPDNYTPDNISNIETFEDISCA
jgi:hypothetical protein